MLIEMTPKQRIAILAVVAAVADLAAEYFEAYEGPLRLLVSAVTAVLGAL